MDVAGVGVDRPRVVVIGAGSNIGLACAAAVAPQADLILADVDADRLHAARSSFGATARYCDVSSEASVVVFAHELLGLEKPFDILVNAAGDGYVRTLGMTRLSRALLPSMKHCDHRQVVVNVAPSDDCPGPFVHAASVEAYCKLSRSFAEYVKHWSVPVLTVVPAAAPALKAGSGAGMLQVNRDDPIGAGLQIMSEAMDLLAWRPTRNSIEHLSDPRSAAA